MNYDIKRPRTVLVAFEAEDARVYIELYNDNTVCIGKLPVYKYKGGVEQPPERFVSTTVERLTVSDILGVLNYGYRRDQHYKSRDEVFTIVGQVFGEYYCANDVWTFIHEVVEQHEADVYIRKRAVVEI